MLQPATPQRLVEELQAEVNALVEELFEGFVPAPQDGDIRRDGKVIRDPIHGFHHLDPLEVEVIDCPLVQRLRYVHQTALAYLVYPSANHTRFEHSLGVAKVVGDIAQHFQRSRGNLFTSKVVGEARLAALLHDVGHGIFSHISESLIEQKWFERLHEIESSPKFEGKAAGEILSYLLVTSKKFRDFLNDAFDRHDVDYKVDRIAGYILGQSEDPLSDAYKSDLITGPIDADKLDYISRDSYFTGIRSESDVANIIRSLIVWRRRSGIGRTLVVNLSGSSFVEQMHFSRLLLFPALYHHQKVRALQGMIGGMFERIWDDPSAINEPRLRFEKITDFFRVTEGEFIALAMKEPVLQRKARRLGNRTLLRRALHISSSVIDKPLVETKYMDLVNLGSGEPGTHETTREIRQEIFDSLPAEDRVEATPRKDPLEVSDIWLDIPENPKITKDIQRCYVTTGDGSPLPLRELFPLDAWLESYAANKWTAHVFAYPNEHHLLAVNRAARRILGERYELSFCARANTECKLPVP